ncbi:zinc finger protein 385D-like isoform X2 [Hypomesus transpacificus]|nr:zinc finger protein 385D-like isoform X2 [Hypomesus transpacificus]XP_046874540.1 zinc finger protein 385D-like isoform X2 [Hypomesus transpacificus]
MCQSATLPSLVQSTAGRAQHSMEMKPLLPFSLFPVFTEMDHLHKALIGPGFQVATPLRKAPSSCSVCRLKFNSESQASSHYSGTKHAKKLKITDAPDCKSKSNDAVSKETPLQPLDTDTGYTAVCEYGAAGIELAPPCATEAALPSCLPPGTTEVSAEPVSLDKEMDKEAEGEVDEETEEEKAMRLLYCSLCKVAVNSASQLQAHNSGTKHKTMLAARSGDGSIKSFPRSGVKAKMATPTEALTGLQNKTFHCEICDVHVNSETQLKQHISSRRHKDRAAGKPAKPKFSPYSPTQRSQTVQAVRLALRKEQDLGKPLASCLLQQHLSLATAAAMATLSPFHLRPASTPNPALFQAQTLPQALLHPPPGPIRSARTPVLFSPY